jgi:hypothetical protein
MLVVTRRCPCYSADTYRPTVVDPPGKKAFKVTVEAQKTLYDCLCARCESASGSRSCPLDFTGIRARVGPPKSSHIVMDPTRHLTLPTIQRSSHLRLVDFLFY